MRNKRQSGFTFIELLVVISIISLLSSIVLMSLTRARMKARDAKRLAQVHQIVNALNIYVNNGGSYDTAAIEDLPGAGQDNSGDEVFLIGLAQADIMPQITDGVWPGTNGGGGYLYIWKNTFDGKYFENRTKRQISCGANPEAQAVLLFWLEQGPSPSYPIGYGGGNAVCFY